MYVDDDAPAGGDGTTWLTAYRFLQDGLAFAAIPANGVTEVRVAQGVYKPDRSDTNPGGTGDREATFQLLNNVKLLGGYRGFEALAGAGPDDRSIEEFPTVLSGDILAIDGFPSLFGPQRSGSPNSIHVVTGSGVDQTALMEGFTITAGHADAWRIEWGAAGGGCLAILGNPTIRQCRFESNTAHGGGGLFIYSDDNVAVDECVFRNNYGAEGSGLYVVGTRVQASNCKFIDGQWGAACWLQSEDQATISNCQFHRNISDDSVILFPGGAANVEQCVFNRNFCAYEINSGGALRLISCTIVPVQYPFFYGPEFIGRNTIFQSEESAQEVGAWGSWNYCLVPSNYAGSIVGVIYGDPMFVDIDGADGILGNEDDDLRLRAGSHCIDSGDSTAVPAGVTTDLNGLPRFVDDPDTADTGVGPPPIVDMGAFEYQPGCDADVMPLLTGNGVIDIDDLLLIVNHWGWTGTPGTNAADITGNGTVDIDDLLKIVQGWGPCG